MAWRAGASRELALAQLYSLPAEGGGEICDANEDFHLK